MFGGVPRILCFVSDILRLVYPMLPVSLEYLFLIAPSVFTNIYSAVNTVISQWLMIYSLGNTINLNNTNDRIVLVKI